MGKGIKPEISLRTSLLHSEARLREEVGELEGIGHSPTTGTSLEDKLAEFLKLRIPERFAITTNGFVAQADLGEWHSNEIDIVIYDKLLASPLLPVERGAILPLEAVWAVISVKQSLTYTSFKKSLDNLASVKPLRWRYWIMPEGHPVCAEFMSVRAYMFFFQHNSDLKSSYASTLSFSKALQRAQAKRPSEELMHIHGACVLGWGYFWTAKNIEWSDPKKIGKFEGKGALTYFLTALHSSLITFNLPPFSPNLALYMEDPPPGGWHSMKGMSKLHIDIS